LHTKILHSARIFQTWRNS